MNQSTLASALTTHVLNATVIVAALGYLVDVYDFFLFNVVRIPSLGDLGLDGAALTTAGLHINSWQLAGIISGSYVWGVLGDKYGRKSCILASIFIYSVANIYCAFVDTVPHYVIARALAGFGLSGELGMGLTLIAEKLTPQKRGHGINLFFILGYMGVLCAAFASDVFSWRTAYMIGGVAGLSLLLARAFVFESSLYLKAAKEKISRGGLGRVLRNPGTAKKYIGLIFIMTTFTFTPQIMWTLAPELAKAQGIDTPIKGSTTLLLGFAFGTAINIFASWLSEKFESRRKAIFVFYAMGVAAFLKIFFVTPHSASEFYLSSSLLGLFTGAWVVAGIASTEQFGTNIRATVATTIPNFARGLAIPMNMLFAYATPRWGAVNAVGIIGFIVFTAALWGWFNIDETYGKNLDYKEI